MITQINIKPRYQETDQMQVVHHSVYPVWYELGRIDYCDQLGLPFHEIEAKGLRQALVELEVKYLKPTVFGQTYALHTKVIRSTKVKLVFSFELVDEDGQVVNKGKTLLAWLDESLRPLNLAKAHPDIYTLLEKHIEKE